MTRQQLTISIDGDHGYRAGDVIHYGNGATGIVTRVETIPDPVVQKFVVTVTHPPRCGCRFCTEAVRVVLERYWMDGHTFDVEEVTE